MIKGFGGLQGRLGVYSLSRQGTCVKETKGSGVFEVICEEHKNGGGYSPKNNTCT